MFRHRLPVLLAMAMLCGAAFAAERQPAKVTRVVDGDTIVVSLAGKRETVRFLRVNTPESKHPDQKQNIPAGKAASAFTTKHLASKTVRLEAEGPDRDKYSRLLRYVWIDGKNFCLELVQQGHSPFYTPYGHGEYKDQFKAAEKEARDAKRGIWGDPALAAKYLRLKSKWGMQAAKYDAKLNAKKNPPGKAAPKPASGYVASKRSKVFHRSDCEHAKKIAAHNLTSFKARDEAIKSGRRPCKACEP